MYRSLKLVHGLIFFKIVAKNLSLITQIYGVEKQHIFRCTDIIVALQFPCQILQYLFEVIQKSSVMVDILKRDVIIP